LRILITGATGFLGRPLTENLCAQGHEVTALVRHPPSAQALLPQAVRLQAWRAGHTLAAGFIASADYEAVIHLAGASIGQWPWNSRRRRLLWDSRVAATETLIGDLAGQKVFPRLWINASGMGYHGDAGNRRVTEDGPCGGDFLAGLAKAWEDAALSARGHGARVICLRFGMILDRDGGALPAMAKPFRLGLGARLGSGRQGQPWIHREDAIGLILFALREDSPFPALTGPVHAVAPTTPSQAAFAEALAREFKRPLLFRAPAWALRLSLGRFADLLLHGQYGEPAKAQAAGYVFRFGDAPSALRDIFA